MVILRIFKIPDWDFEWQGVYHFNKMKKIDGGSTIKSIPHITTIHLQIYITLISLLKPFVDLIQQMKCL